MTQHQRILQLHENREWVCQAEYRNISWCPHKRRKDIEEGRANDLEGNKIPFSRYYFDYKECEHGIKGSRDYLLVRRVDQDVKEELDEIQEDTTSMEEKIEQIERLNL
mgnify:CR=1 FL=1